MASRYHWVTNSNAQTTNVDAGVPIITLTVPAGGRIVRIRTNALASGIQGVSGGTIQSIAPIWMQDSIKINSTQYPNRSVHYRTVMLQFRPVALYDNSLIAGTGRVYTAYHYGGDELLSANFKCSYGGPGKAAITVTYSPQYSRLITGTNTFGVASNHQLWVLYYL